MPIKPYLWTSSCFSSAKIEWSPLFSKTSFVALILVWRTARALSSVLKGAPSSARRAGKRRSKSTRRISCSRIDHLNPKFYKSLYYENICGKYGKFFERVPVFWLNAYHSLMRWPRLAKSCPAAWPHMYSDAIKNQNKSERIQL